MNLTELSARIGKTKQWREVAHKRIPYIMCKTHAELGLIPDLEASWPLLLLDMPEHFMICERSGDWVVYHPQGSVRASKSRPTRAEADALAWLQLFEEAEND